IEILEIVTKQLRDNDALEFDDQIIGNMLYGLKPSSHSIPEVLNFLDALYPHVSRCTSHFRPVCISNCLYGTRNMDSKYSEVQSLLASLLPHIRSCKEKFDEHAIS